MSETNLEQFREVAPAGRFTLQNSSLLKVRLDNDSIQAKLGSMVAYQGDVRFEHQGGGLGRFFKKALTGEGVKLMSANGVGDLFLAQDARKIMVIDLNSERMTVNGDSILAFEGNVDWDIRRVEGAGRMVGGLFNVVLEGTGKVAVTSHGEPVLLDTNTPTFADPDSAIAWSGGVRTSVRSDISFKTFLGRGSGETFQVSFEGPGWVLMQPSEGPTVPEHSHGDEAGGGGGLGSLFGND
ncbi:MAG: AIM24 family protein [Actinobacteria bacterium]|nr:AIM24 family protein [Actinomycetota bacterium]